MRRVILILTLFFLIFNQQKTQAQYLSSNNCGSDKQIDVFVQGIHGQTNPSVNIGNMSGVTQIIVTVWVEDSGCPGNNFTNSMQIKNGSQTKTVNPINVTQSPTSNALEKIYRATINNPTSSTVSLASMGGCQAASISVQKVKTSAGRASYARAINQEFHNSSQTYTMNIGSATQTRNIRVHVPIHEKDNGRIARVEVWGNGVPLKSAQITNQNKGNEAGLIKIDLNNVPASTTQLNVKVISPTGSTGDSFGVGVLTTETTSDCSCTAPSAGSISGGGTFCGSFSGNKTISNTSSASGGSGGSIQYQWEYRVRSTCSNSWGSWTNWGRSGSSEIWNASNVTFDHQFRRKARRSCGSNWAYSNVVTFEVNSPATNAGSISGGGAFCNNGTGNYTLNGTAASGGCGGAIEYQWEYRNKSACGNSWGGWNNWHTTQSVSNWNYTGNWDHQFRRKARRSGCGNWIYSNTITFDIQSPATNAGTISGGGVFCNSMPGNFTLSGTAASGGCGASMEYLWQYRNRSVCSGTWSGWNNWQTTQSVANWNYTGSNDHEFRRLARRQGCGNWLYSNIISFHVDQPFTSGGGISGNQTNCGSFNPSNITSTSNPSGGCGSTWDYQWEYRNGTSGAWAWINGATGATYDPGTISQTRQYRRAAKRHHNCGGWVYSNVVTKTVYAQITNVVLNTNKLEYCHGETATLTAAVTGGSGLSYSWQWSSNGTSWNNASSDPNSNVWNLTNGNLANADRWWRVVVTGGTCSWTSHSVKTSYIPTPSISVNNATICTGGSATLTSSGYNASNGCFELADYASGVDKRAWTGTTNAANITAGGISHWTGCGRSNYFDFKRVGGTTGYAEYQMQFTAQNWTNYQTITVNQCQSGSVRYKMYIYDNNGWRDLGFSGTNGGTHTFNLPTNTTHKNSVSRIIIRVFAADLAANQNVRFHLNHIQVCGASRTWNTGETTAAITKSPTSTTNYNVVVKYGDCSVTKTGTITVVSDPSVKVQADKQALCNNQGTTLRSTVTGGTGSASYQWQWSADASSWTNVSSNGTSANYNVQGHTQGTVRYWRVIVTQGSGCQSTSHHVKTTWIKTPSITVNNATICTGGSATLTASGYSASEGCFNVADFRSATTVDKRGSIASSNNSHVTVTGISKSTTYGSGVNYFDVKRIHNGSTSAYADYNFTITQQDWSNFKTIRVNNIQSGNARYQLYIKDNSGYKNLGYSGTNGDSHTFTLPSNAADKNVVTQIKMRFNGNDLPYNQSIRAHIQNFQVCGTSISWNTGETTTSITKSPTSTTNYTVTVKYGDCTATKTGTITVTGDPTLKVQADKQALCNNQGTTLRSTVTGGTGSASYQWQWSSNGTTWTNVSSNGTSANYNVQGHTQGTIRYWRVIVTQGSGCQSTSHSIRTTWIKTPNISIANKTICTGSSATLTASGYSSSEGCFQLADYSYGVDQRAATSTNSAANITAGGINHWTGCGRSNWFDFKRVGAASGYAQYQMQFSSQNWTNYQTITVNQCQTGNARYRFYIYDNNGWRDLGFSGTNGGAHTFNLPTNVNHKNDVTRFIIRVFAADLAANQNVRFHLNNITVCGNSISWNTGETTTSITKSPTSTTNYTATVKYGDCTATKTGTITVQPNPTITCEASINNGSWTAGSSCVITVCKGDKVVLSVNPNGAASYTWTGPNGFSGNGNANGDILISNNMTTAMAGTYSVTVTDGNGCSSTKQMTVNVNAPITSTGSISGGGTFCSNMPGNFTMSGTAASGGSGGTIQYQWEYRNRSICSNSWGAWTTWGGQTSQNATWNYTGSNDHQFRRKAKRSSCGDWVISNVITFDVESPLTTAGTISGGGIYCSNGPGNMTFSGTASSGGCGGSIQYQWEYRKRSSCSNSWGSWTTWGGRTSQTATWNYTGNEDHQFRRKSKRSTCGNWLTSNTISFHIDKPFTSAGTISGNETNCGSFDPANITSTATPSGGCGGTTQYQWQFRNGTSGTWANVSGATSTTYNPSTITQTRQYRRAARRSTCSSNWVYSNVVTKTVTTDITKVVLQTSKSEYCTGETATLTATVTGGSSLSYSWQYSSNGSTWTNANSDPNSNVWNLTNGNLANTDRWWRVIVTGAGGCSYTSHAVKTTHINTPSFGFNNATICEGQSATLTLTGYNPTDGCFDLTGYEGGIDGRGSLATSNGDISIPLNITYASGANGTNYFDLKRETSGNGYADYNFNITAQDWTNFQELTVGVSYSGAPKYRVYIKDAAQGYTNIGTSSSGNTQTFNLPTNTTKKDAVNQVKIRIFANDLGAVGTTQRVHLSHISVCGASVIWSPTGGNGATATVSPTTTTSYTATIKYGDCQASLARTVTVSSPPTVNAGTNQTIIIGNNANLSASATGGTAPYTFTWNNGLGNGANKTVSPTTTTTYTVTVTDSKGCTDTDDITVNVNACNVTVNAGADKDICQNDALAITATPSGGTAPFTYAWNDANNTTSATLNVNTSLSPNPSQVRTFTVTITDANGCTATDNVTVNIRKQPAFNNVVTQGEICGNNDGAITFSYDLNSTETTMEISIDGGSTFPYTVNVDGSAPAANLGTPDAFTCKSGFYQVINGSGANNGQLYIFDVNSSSYVPVGSPSGIETNAIGYNTIDGYIYGMADNTSTDALGATVTQGDLIKIDADGEAFRIGKVNNLNYSNGDIDNGYLWITRVNTILKVDISNANIVTSATLTGSIGSDFVIANGKIYSGSGNKLFVVDINSVTNGQTLTRNTYTVTNLPNSAAYGAIWAATNTTNGQKEIYFSNNNTGIIYRIDNYTTTTPTAVQVGTGSVTGNNDGTSCPNAQAGVFLGQDSYTINNLSAGAYNVKARWGDNECPVDINVTVPSIDGPTVTTSSNQTICEGQGVNLSANATGGTAPYTYNWDNGLGTGKNKTAYPVPSSYANEVFQYTVTVTDANGCSQIGQVNVTVLSTPDATASKTNPHCGQSDGTITFTFPNHPDRTGIEFSIDGGSTFPSTYSVADNIGSLTVSGLAAGTYTPRVRWGNDECPVTLPNQVLTNEPGPIASAGNNKTVCENVAATLTASAISGTTPYTYNWSGGLGNNATTSVTPTLTGTNDQTFTYTVTVTDANNCTHTDQVNVLVRATPNITSTSSTNTTCGNSNGSITINFSDNSSRSGIQFSLDGGTTYEATINDNQGSVTYSNKPAGTYLITSKWGDNSCPITVGTVSIGNTPGPNVSAGLDRSVCLGDNTTLTANGTGGTGTKTYVWKNANGTTVGTTASITVSPTANMIYTVVATDQNGCTASAQTIVTVRDYPTGTLSKSDPFGGMNNGSITINFSNHPDETIIQFSLDGGATYQSPIPDNSGSVTYNNLGAGSYTIYARWGDNECPVKIGDINLVSIGDPTVTIDDKIICEGATTTLVATASSGTTPYTFTWSNGLGSGTSKTVGPTTTTVYTVTVTDANGRTSSDQATVTVLPRPQASFTTAAATCGNANGAITLTFPDEATRSNIEFSLDGGNNYQPQVLDNSGTVTYFNLSAGNYSIYARWGNDECPVSIGAATINSNTDPNFCNPTITFQKSAVDTIQNNTTIVYTFTINNNAGMVLNNVELADTIEGTSKFISNPANMTAGLQVVGVPHGTSQTSLTLNNIPIGVSTFELMVYVNTEGDIFCNQAYLSGLSANNPNLSDTLASDDPDTTTPSDETCTVIWRPEICTNGKDDDLDGFIDCDDPECENRPGNTGRIQHGN